jgi:hypothetical protein
VAVIGGLLSSTALSLLVVPVAFTYVDGLERRLARFFARGGEQEDPAADIAPPAPLGGGKTDTLGIVLP